MSETIENPLLGKVDTPPAIPTKTKRPKLTPEQKIAELEKKQNQLAERIKDEKAKISKEQRKQDTRRKIVAGAIALENMEHDENFKHVMQGLLIRHVKESDRKLFDF